MVQVGTGQVLSIPSVEATHFGRYLCKAQNLFWEISSPEILMEEEAESSDPTLNLSVELSYSGRLTLGISVNLTCCGAANPAAENYTWYRSTGANGSSMVQVGTGQVLSIPSVEATHFGRYLCKAQNLFWEISSPEILMEEEAESSGE
ncbi:B-cell receptor CD22-like [Takifugu flavidus]|uniref:B-cell receptor CD22-like n=1 Tax=Takifugu flavidus TaxID=433684 RepID=UPI002544C87A|nr:B-cell receptor CD22-like [Takifugu flavidus]